MFYGYQIFDELKSKLPVHLRENFENYLSDFQNLIREFEDEFELRFDEQDFYKLDWLIENLTDDGFVDDYAEWEDEEDEEDDEFDGETGFAESDGEEDDELDDDDEYSGDTGFARSW